MGFSGVCAGAGRISDADLDEALREIRTALLEADVDVGSRSRARRRDKGPHLGVSALSEPDSRSAGRKGSQRRARARRLAASRSRSDSHHSRRPSSSSQDSRARERRRQPPNSRAGSASRVAIPMLVGADLQRPAAVEQLRVLGQQAGVPVFSEPTDPVAVAAKGLAEATEGRVAMFSSSIPPDAWLSTPI